MTGVVTRADRLRDGMSVALLVGSAALYWYAYTGMRTLAAHPVDDPKQKMANLFRFEHLWNLSRAGRALFFVGMVAIAVSAIVHVRRRTRS